MKKDKMMMFSTANAVQKIQKHQNRATATRGLRVVAVGLALLAGLTISTQASAWSYTLVDPIVIDGSNNAGSGVFGTINQVNGHFTNPTPIANSVGTVLDNSTDKTLQDFVWFSITLDAGSVAVDQITVSVVPVDILNPELYDLTFPFVNNPIGASYASGTGVAPNDNGGGVTRPPVQIGLGIGDYAEFNWDFGEVTADNLQGGDTSAELLWVGELLISGGQGTIFNNTINFMISTASSPDFTVQGVVPEPSTGLLVSGGLIGMAMKRRRRAADQTAGASRS